MPRIAANLGLLFSELPPLERFGAAAAAGFKAVELLFPYAMPPNAVKEELTRHRLEMLGINTMQGREGEFGLAGIPGREQDFDAAFRQALDYQRLIGGNAIHCLAGVVPPDQRPAAEPTFIRNIARAADLAGQHGITILLEPINTRDRPNYYLTRLEQTAALIERIARPNVRIQFDCYHLQIMGGDLITRFEEHMALIGHVQFAGVPGRTEPDLGRGEPAGRARGNRQARLRRMVRGRIPARRQYARRPRLGAAVWHCIATSLRNMGTAGRAIVAGAMRRRARLLASPHVRS